MKRMIKSPRLASWAVYALLLAASLVLIAPNQLPIILLKACYITIATVIGYYADRVLFPYSRPHEAKQDVTREIGVGHNGKVSEQVYILSLVYALVMLRRAAIVGAVIVAFALGL